MENSSGMISVIVPIYNVEPYLPRCIESIQNQTYSNLEIILVDDGSPDNSGKICDEYAAKDARIRVLHTKNQGVCCARNAGIEMATGEFLTFCDGDDSIKDTMLEELHRNLLATQADISICSRELVYGEHTLSSKDLPDAQLLVFDAPACIQNVLHTKYYSVGPAFRLFRRSLLGDIRFDPAHLSYEDYVYSAKLFLRAKKVCYSKRPLYNYTQREGSAMHSGYLPKHAQVLSIQEEFLAVVESSPYARELRPYAQAGCLYLSLMIMQKLANVKPAPKDVVKGFSKRIRSLCNRKSLALLPRKTQMLALLAGCLPPLYRFFRRSKYAR